MEWYIRNLRLMEQHHGHDLALLGGGGGVTGALAWRPVYVTWTAWSLGW